MGTYKITHEYSAFKKFVWHIVLYLSGRFLGKGLRQWLLQEIPHMTTIPRLIFLFSNAKNIELQYAFSTQLESRLKQQMTIYHGTSFEQWKKKVLPLIDNYYKMRAIEYTRNPLARIKTQDFLTEDIVEYVKATVVNLLSNCAEFRSADTINRFLRLHIKNTYPNTLAKHVEFLDLMNKSIETGLRTVLVAEWKQYSGASIEKRERVAKRIISKAICNEGAFPIIFRILKETNNPITVDANYDLSIQGQIRFVTKHLQAIRNFVFEEISVLK